MAVDSQTVVTLRTEKHTVNIKEQKQIILIAKPCSRQDGNNDVYGKNIDER